ncbi:MAG: hypothetical protein AAGA58_01890 [Verrucomicrobiota bacterium]
MISDDDRNLIAERNDPYFRKINDISKVVDRVQMTENSLRQTSKRLENLAEHSESECKVTFKDTRLNGSDLRGVDFGIVAGKNEGKFSIDGIAGKLKSIFQSREATLFLDACQINDARFDRDAREPWHVLKREYSGYRSFLIFLLVALTFLPLISQIFLLKGYAEGMQATENLLSEGGVMHQALQRSRGDTAMEKVTFEQAQSVLNWARIGIRDELAIIESRDAMWLFLLKKFTTTIWGSVSLFLLIYAIFRAIITLRVSEFFRYEQSVGISPPWRKRGRRSIPTILHKYLPLCVSNFFCRFLPAFRRVPEWKCVGYRNLFFFHWHVMRWAFYLALILSAIKFGAILSQPIPLPLE